jgi:hypothetical protein
MSRKDGDFRWIDGVSLRDYVDSRLSAMDRAVVLAREQMERRLDGMNEFRDTLRDQASKFITRAECDLAKDKIEDDVQELREFRAALDAKASQGAVYIAYGLSALGLLLGAIGLLVR